MRRNLYILAQCTFLLFITLLVNGCYCLHFSPSISAVFILSKKASHQHSTATLMTPSLLFSKSSYASSILLRG